jgi:hypothetical protein
MLSVRGLRLAQGARAEACRQAVIDFVTGLLIAAPAFWLFTRVLAISLPAASPTGLVCDGHLATAAGRLRHRRRSRSTCCGPSWAARWAPPSACCPGSGRAVAVAHAAADHRAGRAHVLDDSSPGIYYGAMYGGSTTSILLNTPGETGSMVTALEGYQDGRAAAAPAPHWPPRPSAPSSRATIATVLVTLFAPVVGGVRGEARPAGILPAHGAGLHHA